MKGILCALVMGLNLSGEATPLRRTTLDQIVQEAQIIVFADVGKPQEIGPDHINFRGTKIPSTRLRSALRNPRLLKGTIDAQIIEVEWQRPHGSSSLGYRTLESGNRIVFLKISDGRYVLANPMLPSAPAAATNTATRSYGVEGVLQLVSAAASDEKLPLSTRREAARLLSFVIHPIVERTYKSLLLAPDPELHVTAATALLQRNDWRTLELLVPVLVGQSPSNLPWYTFQNFSSAIASGVTAPEAIPALRRLIVEGVDVRIRRAAASALRRTGSPLAMQSLAVALKDSDSDVRYEAVIGLADLLDQPAWRPLRQDFDANESRYIDHWLNVPLGDR